MTDIWAFGSRRRDWNRKMEKVAPYLILVVIFLQVGVFGWWLVNKWDHLTTMDDVGSTIYFLIIGVNLVFLLFEAYKIFWDQNCFHLLLFVFMACFTTFCNLLISVKLGWYFLITIILQTLSCITALGVGILQFKYMKVIYITDVLGTHPSSKQQVHSYYQIYCSHKVFSMMFMLKT